MMKRADVTNVFVGACADDVEVVYIFFFCWRELEATAVSEEQTG